MTHFAIKLKLFLFRKYRNKCIKTHKLNYLFWECTLRCNLNCLHCGSDCLKDSEVVDMPGKDFINVLDDIKMKGGIKSLTVCITGGEPLLRNDLEEVGKAIVERGYNWGIVTNALALSPERFMSLMNAGLSSLSFSIDGLEKEHTYMRKNPSSFRQVVNAINIAAGIQKLNPDVLVFDVITCVHKGNLNILRELRDFLIEKEVKMWRIFSIFPEGRASQNNLSLSKDEYIQLMNFIEETRSYKNAKGKSIHLNYACEGFLGKYELKVRDSFYFCRAGINVASVMCNGDVGACLSVRNKAFIQGNIYESDFTEIWKQKYLNMRDRSWAKTGKCKKCKQWKNCLGNGLHLHKDDKSEPSRCNYELLERKN